MPSDNETAALTADEIKALQAPLKARYKQDPAAARHTLVAQGRLLAQRPAVRIETGQGRVVAGLHPATGGSGADACSGDMLLESLAACSGVTLKAVATALGIPIREGVVIAEGDLDFRGTLGMDREVPVGFSAIRLRFILDTDADDQQLDLLLKLAERYCVIYQTLKVPPQLSLERTRTG
ncbi:OsmC family protein [uncultured Thiodictyon sp.]|uniref:OsmC family protein n=1 Tax=uncultured Thiodictyon sp. TaxID=1846217 RepID=UPI0025D35C0E|nr:OsmC family protein [uncultured Thiodictyon sp.]